MRTRFGIIVSLLLLSPAWADDPAKDVPAPNLKIVQFCEANKTKKVDSGECAALAEAALKSARCRRFPPYGLDADYVWGNLVADVVPNKDFPADKILPGDILQMRNARFPALFVKHHTAVVVAVKDGGRAVSVLEQNAGKGTEEEKRKVKAGAFPLGDLKDGWVKVYRPVALPPPAKETPADPFAANLVRLLNAERKKRGVEPLTFNARLGAASLALAKRAAADQPIQSADLVDAIQEAGYAEKSVRSASISGGSSAEEIVRLWLRTPGVMDTLLSADFTEIGINAGVANKKRLLVRFAICASPAVTP